MPWPCLKHISTTEKQKKHVVFVWWCRVEMEDGWGALSTWRQKKGTLLNIENFPKKFAGGTKKNQRKRAKKSKIKSPPNLCLLANFVTSPLEIHTVAAPPPQKTIMQHPFGFRCTYPGTGQPMAASLGCPAKNSHFWGFPAPILLMVQNSGSPVELDSLSHYLWFFGSTSQVVKKEPDFWSINSTIFRKGGVDGIVFPSAVRGERCLEPPKICRLRGFSLVDLGTGSPVGSCKWPWMKGCEGGSASAKKKRKCDTLM